MTAVERRIKRAERRRLCEESEGENVWNGGGKCWNELGMHGKERETSGKDDVVW